jgi:hypothetical protein
LQIYFYPISRGLRVIHLAGYSKMSYKLIIILS